MDRRNIAAGLLILIIVLGGLALLSIDRGSNDRTAEALADLKAGQDAQSKADQEFQTTVYAGLDQFNARLDNLETKVAEGDKATQGMVESLAKDEKARDEVTQQKLDDIKKDTNIIKNMLNSIRADLLEPMYRRLQDVWYRFFGPRPASRDRDRGSSSGGSAGTTATSLPAGNTVNPDNNWVDGIPPSQDPAIVNDNEPVETPREPDGPFPSTTTTVPDDTTTTTVVDPPASDDTTTTTVAPDDTTTTLAPDPPPAGGDGNQETPVDAVDGIDGQTH